MNTKTKYEIQWNLEFSIWEGSQTNRNQRKQHNATLKQGTGHSRASALAQPWFEAQSTNTEAQRTNTEAQRTNTEAQSTNTEAQRANTSPGHLKHC